MYRRGRMEVIEKNMNTKRIRYLDLYKGIGIIMVVLGHMQMIPIELKLWIEAFHMPLFFVASGMLIGEKKLYERDAKTTFGDRACSVLIPYFWFSLIAVLWDAAGIFLDPAQYTTVSMISKIWDSLSFYGVSVLWFLPAFFVGTTGYQSLRKRLRYPAAVILLGLLAAVICSINSIPDYLAGKEMNAEIFFLQLSFAVCRGCVGMFFCAVGEGVSFLTAWMKERKLLMVSAGILLTGTGTIAAFGNYEVFGTMVSFRYLSTGNTVLFFLASVCLSTGVLLLCRWVSECPPIEYLGRNSLIIMLTHMDLRVMNIAQKTGDKIFETFNNHFVRSITVFVVILGLEMIMIWLFNGILSFMIKMPEKSENRRLSK